MASHLYPASYPGQTADLYQAMGVITTAGLIFSIIMHEVAHAVIAEYYKMSIASITLFIFGGVAEMKGEPSHPKGEFYMAIAGPIMSALLGLFFWALSFLYTTYISEGSVAHVLKALGNMNMLIAVFNIVPAFPLDGGRAFRAFVWQRKNNLVAATRLASDFGSVFAYGLIAYSLYEIVVNDDMLSGIWVGILGMFLASSGDYAVRQVESRSLLGLETVARFMQNNIITVSPDLTVQELVDSYINKHFQRSFPVVDHGVLVGVVDLKSVLTLDRQKWRWLHVGSVMTAIHDEMWVGAETSAADALERLQKQGKDQLMVADDGHFKGVVTYRDISNFLAITMKIDNNKPVEKSRTAY